MVIAILSIIVVCCVAVIAFVVGRKLPLAARIDIEHVHGEQEARLKKKLIEDRLYRKWKAVGSRVVALLAPLVRRFVNEFHRWLTAIQSRERFLRVEQLKQSPNEGASFEFVRTQVESLIVSERFSEAESRLIELIALHPKHVDAYKLLAEVAIGKKDYVQAQEIYEFILKMDEKNKVAYSALGRLFSQGNKQTEAREMFEHSASLHSTDASDYSALAKLYQATGEIDKAFGAARKACELQSQNPKFLDKLAELAILLGRKVIAKNAYIKLKKVNPDNEKLQVLKEQIDMMK